MPAGPHPPSKGRAKRLLWFVFLYGASLAAFAAVVYSLRFVVKAST